MSSIRSSPKIENNIIEKVYKDGFCIGCGTCVGVCPSNAYMGEDSNGFLRPRIDFKKCDGCLMCRNVCPSVEVNYDQLRILQNKSRSDIFIGDFLGCYSGYSLDNEIRYNSSSGGAITTLLLNLLENSKISGAIVTRFKKNSPLRPEPIIASSREEIVAASGSKYCPVPINCLIKAIIKTDGKFAYVGLPCQLTGLRKAEFLFPELKEKIYVRFGLFCNHCPSFQATELLLEKLGINKNEVVKFSYRGQGWPGKMVIVTREKKVEIPHAWNTYFEPYFFTSKRCLTCQDMLAELADVSFGDAWLPEYRSDPMGASLIISRTEKGNGVLLDAEKGNRVFLKPINQNEVKLSQKRHLWFRKTSKKAFSLFFKITPKFKDSRLDSIKSRKHSLFISLLLFLNTVVSKSKMPTFILKLLPLSLIKRYSIFISELKLSKDPLPERLTKPVNIAIVGNYTSANRGDAAILTGLIQALEKEFKKVNICIFSYFPEAAKLLHHKKVFKPLIRTDKYRKENIFAFISYLIKFLPYKLWAILCKYGINLSWLLPSKREALDALNNADIVIGVGGGYLSDTHTLKVLGRFLDLYLAKSLRKPVILASQSIGPFNHKLYKTSAKFVLDKLDIVSLREPVSKKLLEEMNVTPPLYLTADTAFLVQSLDREKSLRILMEENIPIDAAPFISITCISKKVKWESLKDPDKTDVEFNCYLKAMAELADYLVEQFAVKILLIRMCTGLENYHADDMPALLQVRDLMRFKDKAFIPKGEYTPQEISGILSLMEMHVGTRMHSNILAAINFTPVLAIAYGFKFAGFMNLLGLDEFVLNIRSLDIEELKKKAKQIWQKREEIQENLKIRVPELKKQAYRNIELIRDLIEIS